MRVKECMCNKVVRAKADTTLEEIAKLMKTNNVGCIPICNDKSEVVGFVTDRDIITKCIANNKDIAQTKASDIMTTNVIKTTPDVEIDSALDVMSTNQVRRLPVIENGEIVGMLTIGDIAKNDDISSKTVGYTFECICK